MKKPTSDSRTPGSDTRRATSDKKRSATRRARQTIHGEVQSTERLTPSMIRVVLGGGTLADFTPVPFTDQYINAQFIPRGAPYSAPFEKE